MKTIKNKYILILSFVVLFVCVFIGVLSLDNSGYVFADSVTPEMTVEEKDAENGIDIKPLLDDAKASDTGAILNVGSIKVIFDKNAVLEATSTTFKMKNINLENAKNIQAILQVSLEGTSFTNGKVKIEYPFDQEVPNKKVLKVYAIESNKNKTELNSELKDGILSFETNKFTEYQIIFESTKYTPSGLAIGGIVFGAVVIGLIIIVLLISAYRRKKTD